MNKDEVEKLSEQIHKNYCEYVLNRTGAPYWTGGDYSKLDEETKEADRIQARWVIRLTEKAYREGYKTAIADVHMMPKVRTEAEEPDE